MPRWSQVSLVGPLYYYDLVRLARRGRGIGLRCLYALALLAALGFVYSQRFAVNDPWQIFTLSQPRLRPSELADFGRGFLLCVLVAQSAAVLLVTPVYLAGAIAEEKERKTLPLLFASQLHDHEIVLGKLLARLTHLAFVLLTGLPIVLLTALLAGRGEMLLLPCSFAATGMSLLSIGSMSMLFSVLCRNAMTALLSSYGCVFVFNLCCLLGPVYLSSPLAFSFVLDQRLRDVPTSASTVASPLPAPPTQGAEDVALMMTISYVIVHGLASVICTVAAISSLRTSEPDLVYPSVPTEPARLVPLSTAFDEGPEPAATAVSRTRRAAESDSVYATVPAESPRLVPVSTAFDEGPIVVRQPLRARRWSLLPPPTGDPLLWKEMAHDPPKTIVPLKTQVWGIAVLMLVLWVFYWVLILFHRWCLKDETTPITVINGTLRVASIVSALLWCLLVAFRAASSLSRERERHTLGMLLTLPVERVAILRAKWLGAILRLRVLGILLLGLWTLGLLTGALHPLGVMLLAASCGATGMLLASLGTWLGLVCRNTMWAQLSMALVVMLLFCGPWLRFINQSGSDSFCDDAEEHWQHLWQIGLNPVAAWWVAGFSWSEWREIHAPEDANLFASRLHAVANGFLLLATLAGLFWLAARYRLDREPRD
jgi:ABC-type transport system involved in multi-copper enzyme maturation permease subunit